MTFIFRGKKAFWGPANKPLYGCTIDFTFTRPLFKRLWDCPWIPNLCAAHSLSSWHPLSSVNWRDYSLNRIALPFIPWTTGQSGRWQPGDSIQMEMKASREWCCLSNTRESFWFKGVPLDLPNWVLRLSLHLVGDFSTWNLILNTVILRAIWMSDVWSDYRSCMCFKHGHPQVESNQSFQGSRSKNLSSNYLNIWKLSLSSFEKKKWKNTLSYFLLTVYIKHVHHCQMAWSNGHFFLWITIHSCSNEANLSSF